MTVAEILHTVENRITTKNEREYFLIHEARYKYILEQIEKTIVQTHNLGSAGRHTFSSSATQDMDGKNSSIGCLAETQEKHADQKRRPRVLDVGCFPYHLGAAMELMGLDVYGISSSHEPIKSNKIKICNIETDKFPFKDNFFDIVIFTEVLEHLPQSPALALSQMRRVLVPRGKLVLTTPNIARSINRGKLLLGKSVTYPLHQLLENEGEGSNIYHRHNREYTLKELSTLITHSGLSVETATTFVSYTPNRRRVTPDPLWLKAGKTANYILMMMVEGLRDTLFIVAKK
jgi:2-polyprenyl-3-methyl-5-hydroxy-6-metoxy-1,4-benzoquinol methylase